MMSPAAGARRPPCMEFVLRLPVFKALGSKRRPSHSRSEAKSKRHGTSSAAAESDTCSGQVLVSC